MNLRKSRVRALACAVALALLGLAPAAPAGPAASAASAAEPASRCRVCGAGTAHRTQDQEEIP
jgi:hypothetical protein